jgi:PAS domain S-box-containing protein
LEDNSSDADLIRILLQREGFTLSIHHAVDRKTYEQALTAEYDLIFCDYTIPGFDGLSALRMAAERFPDTPFIFVSGSIGEDLAIEALQAGATDYVLKDRMSRLAPAVRRALLEIENREALSEVEAVARAGQERINRLLQHLPFLLYMADGHGVFRLTWVGQNAEAITGYTGQHILNQKDFWRSRIHPEDSDRALNEMAALLRRGRVTAEYRWQRADGDWRRFIDQQVVVRAEDGQIRDVMGSWHDITDIG